MPKSKTRSDKRNRSVQACTRCRKRKIKCSGTVPCESCGRTDNHCVFTAVGMTVEVPIMRSDSSEWTITATTGGSGATIRSTR